MNRVIQDIREERERQAEKGFGQSHDDGHTVPEFIQYIHDYSSWARMMDSFGNYEKARRRLIQAAALAVACVEMMDRKHAKETV